MPGDATSSPNGWNQWGNHVLHELKTLNGKYDAISRTQTDILIEIARLKARASMYGALGGAGSLLVLQLVGKYLLASVIGGDAG